MKNTLIVIVLVTTGFTVHAQTGTVVLNIEGIDLKKGGFLLAGIFTETNFPKAGNPVKGIEGTITGNRMQLIITDVPPGTYGVAVFQDIDMNKDLKTNFLGIPVEPIGFSNDARIKFGPPSFGDAKFKVEKDKQTLLTITLRRIFKS